MKLNLGCGSVQLEGYVNVDNAPSTKPDMLFDIAHDGLGWLEDESVSEVRAFDFLEHIPLGRTIFVIEEIYRVLKMGGRFEHRTPSTDGRGAFQDPTHLSFWNINTWFYYCPDLIEGKENAPYDIKARFKVGFLIDDVTHKGQNIIHTHGLMYKY
jgi:hypothetical protein